MINMKRIKSTILFFKNYNRLAQDLEFDMNNLNLIPKDKQILIANNSFNDIEKIMSLDLSYIKNAFNKEGYNNAHIKIEELDSITKDIKKSLDIINNKDYQKVNLSIIESNILFSNIKHYFLSHSNLDISILKTELNRDGSLRRSKNLAISTDAFFLRYLFIKEAMGYNINQENASIILSKIINHTTADESSIIDQYPRTYRLYNKVFPDFNDSEYNISRLTYYLIKLCNLSDKNKILSSYLKNTLDTNDSLQVLYDILKKSHNLFKIFNTTQDISKEKIEYINSIKNKKYTNYLEFIQDLQKIDKSPELSSKIYKKISNKHL